ncbi:hypothetical protein E4U58_002323 [Claviceps cyperi]|nr:hypothetical protein E4U58_002323 [Claviceps cyperi]
MFLAVGRAAVERAAARRVLLPSRPAASPSLATQFFCGPARTLSIAARLLSPAKAAVDEDGAPVTTKKRKSAAKNEATKKEAADKKKALEKIEKFRKNELYRELSEAALLRPADLKLLPNSGFKVYLAKRKAARSTHGLMVSWDMYHDLPSEEKEHFAAIAEKNKVVNKKLKKEWALSLPAQVVFLANLARKRMAQIKSTPGEKKRCLIIHDPRQPRRPCTVVGTFVKHRYPEIKYDHDAGPDTICAIANDWRNLSEEQKAELNELNKQERVVQNTKLTEMRDKALQWIIEEGKHWPNLVADLFEKKS